MRIIAAADLHGFLDVYDWLMVQVERESPDGMILAGDLFRWGHGRGTIEEGQNQSRRDVQQRLGSVGCPVFWVMGNDDLIELDSPEEHLFPVHGTRVDLEGFNVVGYQYSPPFMGGVFERPEDQIEVDLARLEHLVDQQTVFVTHCPARGSLDRVREGQQVGSMALRDFLARTAPRAHIHGHIHGQFGRLGLHFNVASAGQKRAMLIDLATMKHEVLD